ncbi:hypothetical protein B1H10_04830 [candidate division KSB1 bacterium 4484_188]|nr:MAG: hypothetical protein B1H10_04830 [candidate division KSB1 bacterium 4484_188]HFE63986.1 hypothetical protein [Caldithrix sp.]
MSFRLTILTATLIVLFLQNGFSKDQADYFGEVSLKINSGPANDFIIERALLYRQVSVRYDSTALLQGKKWHQVLYYPQIEEGEKNVLRLIFSDKKDTLETFYDLFIDLGDSVPDSVHWENEQSKLYLAYNGTAQNIQPESKNISGDILIIKSKKSEAVSGKFDLSFAAPLFNGENNVHNFHITGTFDVPVGEYKTTSLATEKTRKALKKKYKNNIYLALVLSAFIIAIFGFR